MAFAAIVLFSTFWVPGSVTVYRSYDCGLLSDRYLVQSILYQRSANCSCEGPYIHYIESIFWLYSIRSPLQLLNCIESSHRRWYRNKWVSPDLAIILIIICWPLVYLAIFLISFDSPPGSLCFLITLAVSKHISFLLYNSSQACDHGLFVLNTCCRG